MSSSPTRLVPLLYEQLLISLRRGIAHAKKNDIEGRFENLARAADIVAELLAALDYEAGGDLAERLASLYGFWSIEISDAGRRGDVARLQKVAAMVASLHEAWEEAATLVERGEAPVPPASGAQS